MSLSQRCISTQVEEVEFDKYHVADCRLVIFWSPFPGIVATVFMSALDLSCIFEKLKNSIARLVYFRKI